MSVGIFVIESMWTPDKSDTRSSVKPMIDAICSEYIGGKHACWPVLTAVDLEVRLKRGPKRGFGILYFATHGRKGILSLDGGDITLSELAIMMKSRYEGWTIHFGSCLVMGAPIKELRAFKRNTGAAIVSGYTKEVQWVQSSSLEIAWLSELIEGKNRLPKYCAAMVEGTGFIKI